ncbi:MAG: UDP-N-acetylmuramoyl-L-alanine--D-glutamate ligase, partial [Cellulomonadaceae bacterium]|nr:UDP-N-acetylmuramoyl-L-alanine--D-glutamate ligase [Cellulomonadaceae bacterium]
MTGAVEPRLPLHEARVLVYGSGVTGQAVARVLRDCTAGVVIVAPSNGDLVPPADDDGRSLLLASVDLVVASPGIKPADPLLVAALDSGVPVWSEVELAWRLRVDRRSGGAGAGGADG